MTGLRHSWLAVLVACTTHSIPAVRFVNAPPVLAVNDRLDVPAQPEEREFFHDTYHYDGVFQRRLTRALELPRAQRARGVNALDEVPDSTWFTNRIGHRDLTPEQVRLGPLTTDSPELHKPWTIRSTKIGGTTIGFIIKDARGVKYLLKFDGREFPEVETGMHVIVNRLLWACGYNVPEDEIVYFRREDLVVAPDAVIKKPYGGDKGKLTDAEVDRELALVEHTADGQIRALASRWLDGKPLGGHPAEGVRGDDPNDLIPHQLRRDLRGAYSIFSWLDHVDVQEGNFLDMWTKDPATPNRHYVIHYMIDFGKSLGAMASIGFDLRRGHTYLIDLADMMKTFVTAGTIDRSWEHRAVPALPGVALFDAESYDPGSWHPDSPAYVPFLTADHIDKYWGATIVARFTPDQIRAAVDAARLSDPRSAAYLTKTLIARQHATALYWFARTNPLARISVESNALCFDDLPITTGFANVADTTRYTVTTYDDRARRLGSPMTFPAARSGRTCSPPLALSGATADYTIVRVDTIRSGKREPLYVHVARDTSATPRVIGIWRP